MLWPRRTRRLTFARNHLEWTHIRRRSWRRGRPARRRDRAGCGRHHLAGALGEGERRRDVQTHLRVPPAGGVVRTRRSSWPRCCLRVTPGQTPRIPTPDTSLRRVSRSSW